MNAVQQIEEVEEIQEVQEVQNEYAGFEITNLESLDWAFRKIFSLKKDEKEKMDFAASEHERISEWLKKELSPIHNDIGFFESLIQKYHAQVLADDPNKKTISTPYGKSKSRKSSEAPEKQDEAKLLDYAIENDEEDFIKTSINWGNIKKSLNIVEISGELVAVDMNGQIVPGVTVRPEVIKYSVEV